MNCAGRARAKRERRCYNSRTATNSSEHIQVLGVEITNAHIQAISKHALRRCWSNRCIEEITCWGAAHSPIIPRQRSVFIVDRIVCYCQTCGRALNVQDSPTSPEVSGGGRRTERITFDRPTKTIKYIHACVVRFHTIVIRNIDVTGGKRHTVIGGNTVEHA